MIWSFTLGFTIRVLIIVLTAAVLGKKLGTPHPIFGLAAVYYFYTKEGSTDPMFMLGFMIVDFLPLLASRGGKEKSR
jgi:hypothetical protein